MAKRLVAVFCTFMLIAMVLFARLYLLSTDESLLETGAKQSTYSLEFNKTRAQIYDCKLNSLTETTTKTLLACVPTSRNKDELQKINGVTEESFEQGKPLLISADNLSADTKFPDTTKLEVPIRRETNGIAQHVIGYLNEAGDGVCGIEKAYNDYLKSNSATSKISFQVDSRRNPLQGISPTLSYAPALSQGVVLTIDSRIQELIEKIGEELLFKGAIVVMEPQTGKLKAVASFPQYRSDKLLDALEDTENSPLLNRAFSAYCVGSTFKIVTSAAALSQGISPTTMFTCNGAVDVFGQEFSCHQKSGHGEINLKQGMELSCNPYFIQLGQMLDKTKFLHMASDLSFGKSNELTATINSSGGVTSSGGILPSFEQLFNPAAVGNFSFGQGILTATPIQIAQMISAVANEGKTPRAQLIEGFSSTGKTIDQPLETTPPVIAFDKGIAEILKSDLRSSVMETPSQNARPQHVDAAGKTGTAQTGQIKENGEELLQGWFGGFFPVENPKYVVVVLAEDAVNGNKNASPVFAKIADALYAPIYYKGND